MQYNLGPSTNPFWPDYNGPKDKRMVNLLVCVERNRWTHGARWEKIRGKKDWALSPALSATDFICVYNKFFHSNPGVRVKRIFFLLYCLRVIRIASLGKRSTARFGSLKAE